MVPVTTSADVPALKGVENALIDGRAGIVWSWPSLANECSWFESSAEDPWDAIAPDPREN